MSSPVWYNGLKSRSNVTYFTNLLCDSYATLSRETGSSVTQRQRARFQLVETLLLQIRHRTATHDPTASNVFTWHSQQADIVSIRSVTTETQRTAF